MWGSSFKKVNAYFNRFINTLTSFLYKKGTDHIFVSYLVWNVLPSKSSSEEESLAERNTKVSMEMQASDGLHSARH